MSLSVHHLRRHILDCAAKAVRLAIQRMLRQAEVGQRNVTVLVQQNVLRLQIAIDDPQPMQMVQRQRQLSQIELDILLGEHHLLAQAREQITAAQKVQYQIQLAGRLKCIVQLHDERVAHIGENVALVGAPHAILHLERRFLQHLHGVQRAGVHADDFAHQKHFAKRSLAQHFEQLKL